MMDDNDNNEVYNDNIITIIIIMISAVTLL